MDEELRKDIETVVRDCKVTEDLLYVRCCYCYEYIERHHKNCVILRLQKRLENSTV